MPAIDCRCEALIDLRHIPHPDGVYLIPEPAMDQTFEKMREDLTNDGEARVLYDKSRDLFTAGQQGVQYAIRCTECSRLLVFGSDMELAESYLKE